MIQIYETKKKFEFFLLYQANALLRIDETKNKYLNGINTVRTYAYIHSYVLNISSYFFQKKNKKYIDQSVSLKYFRCNS